MKRLVLCLAFLCGSAKAEFYTGNELWNRMNASDSYVELSIALGFIAGVSDALHGVIICPRDRVTVGQARDIVYQYLANNPAVRHLTASSLAAAALSQAWPCAKRGNSL